MVSLATFKLQHLHLHSPTCLVMCSVAQVGEVRLLTEAQDLPTKLSWGYF
jgi:hypothetical protein